MAGSDYNLLYSAVTGLIGGASAALWWGGKTDTKVKSIQEQLNRLEETTDQNHRQVIDILTRSPACKNFNSTKYDYEN